MTDQLLSFGDSHLGYAQYGLYARRQDFTDVYLAGCRYFANQASVALLTGDLFEHIRPDPETWTVANEGAMLLGCPVFAIPGNHDGSMFGSENTWLSKLHNIELLGAEGQVEYRDVGPYRIIGIPWAGHMIRKRLMEANQLCRDDRHNIVFGHFGILGMIPFAAAQVNFQVVERCLPAADAVFVGHFHIHYEKEKVMSAGAWERSNFDDLPGGAFIGSPNEGWRYVGSEEWYAHRPFLKVQTDDLDTLRQVLQPAQDAVVQLTTKLLPEQVRSLFEDAKVLKWLIRSVVDELELPDWARTIKMDVPISEHEKVALEQQLGNLAAFAHRLMEMVVRGDSNDKILEEVKNVLDGNPPDQRPMP